MRDSMPIVTAFIDDLRSAFGNLDVTAWVRTGIADGSFHASENGHTIGAPLVEPTNAVAGTHLVLQAPAAEPDQAPERQRAAYGGSRARSRR